MFRALKDQFSLFFTMLSSKITKSSGLQFPLCTIKIHILFKMRQLAGYPILNALFSERSDRVPSHQVHYAYILHSTSQRKPHQFCITTNRSIHAISKSQNLPTTVLCIINPGSPLR